MIYSSSNVHTNPHNKTLEEADKTLCESLWNAAKSLIKIKNRISKLESLAKTVMSGSDAGAK